MATSRDLSPPLRLRERDAWDMALAWREQLQGCVRLERGADSGDAFRVVDRFEWVTFVLHGARDDGFAEIAEPVDTARCARAASIVWFALSCCSGFSGTENPRFWRRVFSELHAPEGHHVIFRRPRAQLHITDAVRFFDHHERPFPRVCIEPTRHDTDACLRALLGFTVAPPVAEASPLDAIMDTLGAWFPSLSTQRPLSTQELGSRLESHSLKLRAILRTLEPFIRKTHYTQRRLPVAIRAVEAKELAWMVPRFTTRPNHYGLACDQLQLETVFIRDDERHVETAVCSLLARTSVTVELPRMALSPFALRLNDLASTLNPQRLRIGRLSPVMPRGTPFTALCSLLPHTKLITTVHLDATSRHMATIIGLRAVEWVWLGYALFHPDAAARSTFSRLDLDQYRLIDHEIGVLRRMARGNNLLLATTTQQESEFSSHYHEGKLRAGTVVYSSPDDDAPPCEAYSSETWLTLCVASGQFFSLGTWVCAVVPGVGLGWIRRKQILQIVSRAPGPCCLRRLRLNMDAAFGGPDPLLELLAVVGGSLEYLHIVGRRNPLNAATVAAILHRCPSLISLRICHDGSFWSSDTLPILGSSLQELELVVGSYQHLPELAPLRSPTLDNLQSLRVVTLAKRSFVASNRKTFVAILARYPRLQYANWSLGWSHTGCSPLRSYDDHQAASLARFGDYCTSLTTYVDRPLDVSCRLAFLSVVHAIATAPSDGSSAKLSVLGSFGRDCVANIFAFASSPIQRDLYVDDEVEFVTGHFRN